MMMVKNKKKYEKDDPDRKKLERDIEAEEGGAGVYNINLKSRFICRAVSCFDPCP